MSLYRQASGPSRRVAIVAAVLALAAGAGIGYALGSASAEEPSLEEQLAALDQDLRPAISSLDLVGIEYREAVEGGEIVAETEYEAARAHLDSAVSTLESNEADLRAISATDYEAALERLDELGSRIDATAELAEVEAAADRAVDAIATAGGGGESESTTVRPESD